MPGRFSLAGRTQPWTPQNLNNTRKSNNTWFWQGQCRPQACTTATPWRAQRRRPDQTAGPGKWYRIRLHTGLPLPLTPSLGPEMGGISSVGGFFFSSWPILAPFSSHHFFNIFCICFTSHFIDLGSQLGTPKRPNNDQKSTPTSILFLIPK